jgi:hypothetical protein|tara:strand:+ start:734 stop:1105 length:372 start_codon:yes stop_codon:yes gene_type:complete
MAIFDLELYCKIIKTIGREVMFIKKLVIVIFFLVLLNGCAQNTALLGPVITAASTGSVYQAGLSYSSGKIINKMTGRTTGENIKVLLNSPDKTSNSEDEYNEFQLLIEKRIAKTRKIMNLSKN